VSKPLIALSAAVCVGLAFLVSWLFDISLERAFVLGPVIVVGFGLLAMVFVLLVRAAIDNVRELQHPRRFWLGLLAACVAIAALSLLGVELPREG
jgi:MFS-type transporter involved in bile tolerance (Atg22 family)